MAMFENISEFFKRFMQSDKKELLAENPTSQSKETAKDRLHVVLMQDRANVSADFLEMMKEEIIEVIKKYIVVDETKIDVRLTNEENEDGSLGAPLLHANIPILNVRNDLKGSYMNSASNNEKIDGQQEINVEENNHQEAEKEEQKENVVQEEKIEKPKVVLDVEETPAPVEELVEILKNKENAEPEIMEEVKEEDKAEEASVEEIVEIVTEEASEPEKAEESQVVEENQEIEKEIEAIIDDLDDEDLDDDDDVTFDDLLKAAEEEERLKQIEENKEEQKEKKTNKKKSTTQKKTSKKAK